MICYHDRSYCADQDKCVVPDDECSRRLTVKEKVRAAVIEIPIAWMSFKETCGKFKESIK